MKEWVYQEDSIGIYQDSFYDFDIYKVNPNNAVIQCEPAVNFSVESNENNNGVSSKLTVEVPANIMDMIASSWVKQREIEPNHRYAETDPHGDIEKSTAPERENIDNRDLIKNQKTISVHQDECFDDLFQSIWRFISKMRRGVYAPGKNADGRWFVMGKDTNDEVLVTVLPHRSVSIINTLIEDGTLIPDKTEIFEDWNVTLEMYKYSNN